MFALSREVLSFGENTNSENTFWNELGSGSVILCLELNKAGWSLQVFLGKMKTSYSVCKPPLLLPVEKDT